MRSLTLITLSVLAGLVCVACDKSPRVLPTPSTAPQDAQPAKPAERPTAQSLLNGPQKRIPLLVLPLSVEVPESWKVTTLGSAHMLEGPTSQTDMRILLNQRPRMTASQIDLLLQGARREMTEKAGVVKMVELRSLRNVKILERQALGSRPAATDIDGTPLADTSPVLNWTITVFAPQDQDSFKCYELNFLVLTQQQYNADETLLRRIIDSIQLDGIN